jgi:hypothetical protein
LRLALNRLGEDSSWDVDALKLEFCDVLEISNNIDLSMSGFEMGEIDVALGGAIDEEDALPVVNEVDPPVTKSGDLWRLGDHRLLCSDALKAESYERLMGQERAQMSFTDPPWNIAIEDNVSGLGAVKHKDFAMACGEMTPAEFEAFLKASLGRAAAHSEEGALHYVCMHWSKMKEMLSAADGVYDDLINLCVWNKTNVGMGSLYRSKHELIFIFRNGRGRHVNNVALGRFGRHRSNVGTTLGRTSSMGRRRASLSCIRPPSPSRWSPTRSEMHRIVARSSSIRSAARGPQRRRPRPRNAPLPRQNPQRRLDRPQRGPFAGRGRPSDP